MGSGNVLRRESFDVLPRRPGISLREAVGAPENARTALAAGGRSGRACSRARSTSLMPRAAAHFHP